MSYNNNALGLGPNKYPNTSQYAAPLIRSSEPVPSKKRNAGRQFNPFNTGLSSAGPSTESLSTLTGSEGSEGSEGSSRSSSGLSVEPNLASFINEGYVNRKLTNALARNPVARKPVEKTYAEIMKNLENAGIRAQVKKMMAEKRAKEAPQSGLGRRRRSRKARKTRRRKTRK